MMLSGLCEQKDQNDQSKLFALVVLKTTGVLKHRIDQEVSELKDD